MMDRKLVHTLLWSSIAAFTAVLAWQCSACCQQQGLIAAAAAASSSAAAAGTVLKGVPNNLEFLRALVEDPRFAAGDTTTKFLEDFHFSPRVMEVVMPGGFSSCCCCCCC